MAPGLFRFDGMGGHGYDYNAIQVVFDTWGIERERRPELFSAVLRIIQTYDRVRKK